MTTHDQTRGKTTQASNAGSYAPSRNAPTSNDLPLSGDGRGYALGDGYSEPDHVELWHPTSGTYEFPPVPRDVNDLYEFWSRVEIPDGAKRSVVEVYARDRERRVRQVEQDYVREHGPYPHDARDRDVQRWTQGLDQALSTDEQLRTTPEWISPNHAEDIARAAGMHRSAHLMPEAERERALRATLTFSGSRYQPTLAQMAKTYRFDMLSNHLMDKDKQRSVRAATTREFERPMEDFRERQREWYLHNDPHGWYRLHMDGS